MSLSKKLHKSLYFFLSHYFLHLSFFHHLTWSFLKLFNSNASNLVNLIYNLLWPLQLNRRQEQCYTSPWCVEFITVAEAGANQKIKSLIVGKRAHLHILGPNFDPCIVAYSGHYTQYSCLVPSLSLSHKTYNKPFCF